MLNSESLAEFSAEIANTTSNSELEQRLGLYRVFLKLYEHNRGLLDEILELEHTNNQPHIRPIQYVQGVMRDRQVSLVTNLLQGNTLSLSQPENVWVIGRDRKAAIQLQNKCLSRRHAAIQYVEHQGFYLIDFNSTNGTFVNGEPIRQSVQLRDGDQVRLGSLVFSFFICQTARMAESAPSEWLEQVNRLRKQGIAALKQEPDDYALPIVAAKPDTALSTSLEETSQFLLYRA